MQERVSKMKKHFFKNKSYFYLILILCLLYLPIFTFIIFSFNETDSLRNFKGWSIRWYQDLFLHEKRIWKVFLTTLIVAFFSSFFSILIGTFASISFLKNKYKFEKISLSIVSIPLLNADIITGVSLMIIFIVMGMSFGLTTLILAHISFSVPCVVFIIYSRLRKIDYRQIEAALDLGASFFFTTKEIIFPFIRASVLTSFGIVFSMSFDDFIISYFVSGDESNISTYLYTLKRIKPTVNAFSSFLVIVVIFLFFTWKFFKRLIFFQPRNNQQKNYLYLNLRKKIKQSVFLIKTNVFLNKTKKIFYLSLLLLGISGSWFFYQRIYRYDIAIATWGNYISEEKIKDFEEEYTKKINISEYSSNEELNIKTMTNDYDIMFPSEYYALKLKGDGKISTNYDFSSTKNTIADKKEMINDKTKLLYSYYEKHGYEGIFLPYTWGKLVFIFNGENNNKIKICSKEDNYDCCVKEEILEKLKDEQTRLIISDDIRNIFYLAKFLFSKEKEKNVNPKDSEEIEYLAKKMVQEKILKRKNTLRVGDEITDYLQNGSFDIALAYDGDYLNSFLKDVDKRKNDHVYLPETTNYWSEVLVIGKNSTKDEEISNFISYIFEEEYFLNIFKEFGYLSPWVKEEKIKEEIKYKDRGQEVQKNILDPILNMDVMKKTDKDNQSLIFDFDKEKEKVMFDNYVKYLL